MVNPRESFNDLGVPDLHPSLALDALPVQAVDLSERVPRPDCR